MLIGEIIDMRGKVVAAEVTRTICWGKFLCFSPANLLVEKDTLAGLHTDLNIPYSGGKRLSVSDAFRSATGDIQERIPVTRMGDSHIYLACCQDNKRTSGALSREVVKETLNQQTNQYEKLASCNSNSESGNVVQGRYNVDADKACGGFACMISDYLFGFHSNPMRQLDDKTEVRPGDIIIQKTALEKQVTYASQPEPYTI